MPISDHYRGGQTERMVVTIVTSDPLTRRIEGVGRDAAVIQVAPPTGALIQWPQVGDYWLIERENGIWSASSPVENETAIKRIDTLMAGEGLVQPDVIWTSQGNRLVTSKDTAINVMAPLPPYVDVKRDGVTDDSAALQARHDYAATTGKAVYYPAGSEHYVAYNLNLSDNAEVYGDRNTVISIPNNAPLPAGMAGRFIFINKNRGTTGNRNLYIHDLILDGNVSADNFDDEYYFGIAFYSVQCVNIERLLCRNFRGDGIYFGHNNTVDNEDFHVRTIHLENCGVDAGVGLARQGVAIVQGRRFTVRDITANRVGGGGTIGYVVDLEPNTSTQVVEDFTIDGVHGYDCTGGVAISAQPGPTSTFNATHLATQITSVSPTTGWVDGMSISGPGILPGSVVVSGAGTSTMTLSGRIEGTQTGATAKGTNTRRGFVRNVSLRDGPNNTISSIVAISRTDSLHIGRVECDVPSPQLSSGRTIWLDAAAHPVNLTVENTRRQYQERPANFTAQPDTRYFYLSGSGPVSSGTLSWVGHIVTFQVANGVTFTDGSNLKLNGNFAPVDSNSTLTLMYDGTNWVELGRSVNG